LTARLDKLWKRQAPDFQRKYSTGEPILRLDDVDLYELPPPEVAKAMADYFQEEWDEFGLPFDFTHGRGL
jgi:hypothetical protein